MSFFDSLKSLFSGGGPTNQDGYWIYVRCRRCGEVIRARLDLLNSLSTRDEGGYIAQKTLVGSQHCFERIEVTLIFDDNRRLVEREIIRGEFITPEEYAAMQAGHQ
jgi:hypothetical protein